MTLIHNKYRVVFDADMTEEQRQRLGDCIRGWTSVEYFDVYVSTLEQVVTRLGYFKLGVGVRQKHVQHVSTVELEQFVFSLHQKTALATKERCVLNMEHDDLYEYYLGMLDREAFEDLRPVIRLLIAFEYALYWMSDTMFERLREPYEIRFMFGVNEPMWIEANMRQPKAPVRPFLPN